VPCLVLTLGNSFSLFSRMTYGRLCDYLISTDSYVYAGVCVGGRSHQHNSNSLNIGRHNRMSPRCQADIVDMSATDKNVCRLRGGANRHKSRHCQPRRRPSSWPSPLSTWTIVAAISIVDVGHCCSLFVVDVGHRRSPFCCQHRLLLRPLPLLMPAIVVAVTVVDVGHCHGRFFC
jgi:hypothetical protein